MRMNSAKPHGWGGVMVISVLALVVAILGLVLVQGGARAQTFEPEADVTLSDYDAEANADVTTTFNVPDTDYNYGALVSFTPEEFFTDVEVPIGAKVGELDSVATLGILNGPCWTVLDPHFDLYAASTDIYDTVFYDEQWLDSDGNGLLDGIDRYPDFATRILEDMTPTSRMFGYTTVSGSDVTISFVVLEAGAMPDFSAAWGRPSVTLLNDIGDPAAVPVQYDPITDFCTSLASDTTVFGLSQDNPATDEDEGGYEVRRNPKWGETYTFRWYGESFIDADGDGAENFNDTCPFDVNEDPSFKLPEGDPDGDGIDSACDPDPAAQCWPGAPGLLFNDCDDDFFYNRGDNCPLVPNPDQADADTDSIGDACDTVGAGGIGKGPDTADGDPIVWQHEVDVEISGPPRPVAGEDTDGDEFDDLTEDTLGSCLSDPCSDYFCSGVEAENSTPEDTSIAGSCTDGEDNDKDGYIDDVDGGCAEDTDGDGVSDEGEEQLGSDPEEKDSTPEDASICDACTDGEDNDLDEQTDAEDEGCAVAATPTPTPTATPTEVEGTPTPTPTPTPAVEGEFCQPAIPGTYHGLVRIDGQPAQSGYELTASIDDIEWGSAIISGGRYAMDIPDYLPVQEPCFNGGTITFELNDMICTPVDEGADQWAAGLQNVDLGCVRLATPTATATPPPPAATPSPTATAVPPTATPTPTATATPTRTPAKPPPTGSGGLAGPSEGLPLWAMALASWVGLMTVAGLGTLVAAKRP